MTYSQLVVPDPFIDCRPGWCLQYVRQAFGAPVVEPDATAGWNNAEYRHTDAPPQGVWVPLWFAVQGVPEGHVVLMTPDGSVYSTTSPYMTKATHHNNLAELYAAYAPWFPLTYRGWTEDISNVRVIEEITINTESIGDTGMSAQDVQQINDFTQAAADVTRNYIIEEVTKRVNQFTQDASDVTRGYLADQVKNAGGAQAVVNLIPDELVEAVAKGLAERLAK